MSYNVVTKKGFYEADEILHIVNWIKDYFADNGPKAKAVLGISGGKDSTIAAMLLTLALGKDRVVGVMMPNGEQSDIADAKKVCEVLGIENYTINIKDTVWNLEEDFVNSTMLPISHQLTTNVPPRIRMTILYMVAAAVGGRVCNTSNASEAYVGYCTKYGDLAGDFALLKDYYVTMLYEIGDVLCEEFFPDMPTTLIEKAPADGLTGKTDEAALGFTYKELDDYLFYNIYPDAKTLANIKAKHNMAQHKRAINMPFPYGKYHELKGEYAF